MTDTLNFLGFANAETVALSITDGVNSDSLTIPAWNTQPAPVAPPDTGDLNIPAYVAGRITRIVPPTTDLNSINITTHPTHGRLTVEADGSLSWNLLYDGAADNTDTIVYEYDETADPGNFIEVTLNPTILASSQLDGWASGYVYRFETDSNLYSVLEPGENHRKVHISPSGLTADDIAALEVGYTNVTAGNVTSTWILDNAAQGGSDKYGETEALAMDKSLGMNFWRSIVATGNPCSHWLLLKRGENFGDIGDVFADGSQGEDASHPILVDAYGTGARPVITNSIIALPKFTGTYPAKYLALRNLDLEGGRFKFQGWSSSQNTLGGGFLVENVRQHNEKEASVLDCSGVAIRYTQFYRVIKSTPAGANWDPAGDRVSGIFSDDTNDMLIEGSNAYHCGWQDGYDPTTMDGTLPQPVSALSHGFYIQKRCLGLMMLRSSGIMNSGGGLQARGGGYLIENLFSDDNQLAYTSGGDPENPPGVFPGNWSFWTRNIGTQGGGRHALNDRGQTTRPLAGQVGSYHAWIDNAVLHMADPDDAADIAYKVSLPGSEKKSYNPGPDPAYDNTIVYNWKTGEDANLGSLDTGALDVTTLQRYAAAHGSFSGGTIADWAEYYATLDIPAEQAAEHKAVMDFFLDAIGKRLIDERTTAGDLTFKTNAAADGIQWMNPINWSSGDCPISGDNIALGGRWTTCACMTLTVSALDFGAGGKITLPNGYLEHTGTMSVGAGGAELNIDYIGRFVSAGYTDSDLLTINVAGGRFFNQGTFAGAADFNISGGQAIVADAGASMTIGPGRTMEITGAEAKVGFDETGGGTATLAFDGTSTLSFVAANNSVGKIGEFRSGRLGTTAPNVISTVDIGGGTVRADITGLAPGSYDLIDVDALNGSFSVSTVTGGAGTIARVANKLVLTVS